MTLPGERLDFEEPAGATGEASLDGFTPFDGAVSAVFQPNGSVADEGAFRIADLRGNFLEVRVAPAATGRIEIRKWQDEVWRGTGDPTDPDFIAWKWK